ncbi:hypothetical protein ACIGZJ_30775 [Kitasatospora sp. NPDC052868]|uniref:hypothetical protein n=1 Tax=Kitasatospora sp. NPDC052868 TaxID=3364060 RepID=UPI0037CB82D6
MTPAGQPPARRGQPPKLTAARRRTLLDALAGGSTLTAAAAAAGVTRATVHNTRRRDPLFDAAVTEATARARRAAQPPRPACPACTEPALELTPGGAACRSCHTDFHLVPARRLPAPSGIWPALTTAPLAHAG